MHHRVSVLLLALTAFSCATPEERKVAALKQELGLDVAPYFPKCLSEEVSPRAAVTAGDYNIVHTVNNPQGDVHIDRCARWETDEPTGGEQRSEKLLFKKPEKTASLADGVTDPGR